MTHPYVVNRDLEHDIKDHRARRRRDGRARMARRDDK
jgi:hypothetical protein